MEPKEEEIQVIQDILGGNLEAYSFLINKYRNKVFGLLLKMGVPTEDAKDITQETFIKAYQKLENHHLEKSFAGWIYTIAVRTYQERIRGRKNLKCEEISNDPFSLQPTPETEVILQENKKELVSFINELPSNYRLLILLRYTNDLTYEEIEQITGYSMNQIKNGLYRAKRMLKKMLNKEGVVLDEMLEHGRDGRASY